MWALGAKSEAGLQMATAHTPSVDAREGLAGEIFRTYFFWLYGTTSGCVTSLSLILLMNETWK